MTCIPPIAFSASRVLALLTQLQLRAGYQFLDRLCLHQFLLLSKLLLLSTCSRRAALAWSTRLLISLFSLPLLKAPLDQKLTRILKWDIDYGTIFKPREVVVILSKGKLNSDWSKDWEQTSLEYGSIPAARQITSHALSGP
ncbi:MAG TPA: hypothetical protein VFQ36_03850 [Ktedonobacteraceae bacterium]|nr:hypothetical protein [Ktedonobacteraceae bacterium]